MQIILLTARGGALWWPEPTVHCNISAVEEDWIQCTMYNVGSMQEHNVVPWWIYHVEYYRAWHEAAENNKPPTKQAPSRPALLWSLHKNNHFKWFKWFGIKLRSIYRGPQVFHQIEISTMVQNYSLIKLHIRGQWDSARIFDWTLCYCMWGGLLQLPIRGWRKVQKRRSVGRSWAPQLVSLLDRLSNVGPHF